MSKREMSSKNDFRYLTGKLRNFQPILKEKIAKIYNAFRGKMKNCWIFLWEKVLARKYGLPIVLIISVVFIYLLELLIPTLPFSEGTSFSNILIAFSTGSAAILAMIFTMLLIVGQLATSHSPRMFTRVFTSLSIGYMILFLILVVLPLITLTVADKLWLVKVLLVKLSFFLSFLSLSLFIPFLLYLKDRISPENLLKELKKSLLRKVAKLADMSEEVERFITQQTGEMQQLITNAIRTGDYLTCSKGMMVLSELSCEVPQTLEIKDYGVSFLLPDFFRRKMLYAGLMAIPDLVASLEIVKALRVPAKLDTLKNSIFALKTMGKSVVQSGYEETTVEIAYSLAYLGKVAIRAAMEREITDAISALRDLSSDLFKIHPNWEDAMLQSVEAVGFLGVKASEKIMSTDDASAKEILVGKVRRAITELNSIWNRAVKANRKIAHRAAYRIVTVSRIAIRSGVKSETWPESATKFAMNRLSKIAIDEFRRGEKHGGLNRCKALHMLGLEASNSSALKEILVIAAQRLKEVRAEITQLEDNEKLVYEIDSLLNGLRQRGIQLGWGDILLAAAQKFNEEESYESYFY